MRKQMHTHLRKQWLEFLIYVCLPLALLMVMAVVLLCVLLVLLE